MVKEQKEQIASLRNSLLTYKHFVPPPTERFVSERIMNLLNETAREKYEFYSEHFRRMVSKESQLLALFMSWHDSPIGFSWET